MEDFCYCRTIPFKYIVKNPSIYNETIFKVNEIVRQTYQFIRLYVLHCFESSMNIPIINRSFLKTVFSLISVRNKNKNATQELRDFYDEHYQSLQSEKVNGKSLKDILDMEITDMVTNIENHIKNSFYDYIGRLAGCFTDDNRERHRIRSMLYHDNLSSEYSELQDYCDLIQVDKERLYKDTQSVIPLLLKINKTLENYSKKTMAVIPLRRSLIPKYVPFSRTIMLTLLGKEHGERTWNEISEMVHYYFNIKEGYNFSSLKTDGIGCSLYFKYNTRRKVKEFTEQYLEDYKLYEELLEKKIVAIDPNKGNLMYCYDGKNVLRYTQSQRRHETKKTKYKKIRQSEEESIMVRLDSDEEFHTVKSDYDALKQCNSRTTSTDKFKNYIKEKNIHATRFSELFQRNILRKLNFNTKINTKRSEARFLSKFRDTFGAPDNIIVVFGDWEQRKGMSYGKEPTKGKSCRSMLRKAGYTVFLKDEFRTSKLCHNCHSENQSQFITRQDPRPWKTGQSQKVWGLLRCKNVNCNKIHNRDFNSVRNIHFLSNYIINGVDIPIEFKRTYSLPIQTE